jgi:hypothetical protein
MSPVVPSCTPIFFPTMSSFENTVFCGTEAQPAAIRSRQSALKDSNTFFNFMLHPPLFDLFMIKPPADCKTARLYFVSKADTSLLAGMPERT